ncbi:hypothetical protein N8981_03220 [Planktomarina temperata]|nr:hypothetical protein [Planktomarina temperata]
MLEKCDLHFLNNWNLKKYQSGPHTTIMTVDKIAQNFGKYEIKLELDRNIAQLRENNISEYSIENSGLNRPIGPGIMYESVLPILAYLKVKKIITVGWDIAAENGSNTHFYNNRRLATPVRAKSINPKLKNGIKKIVKSVSLPFSYLAFSLGYTVNKARMKEGEAERVKALLPAVNEWLLVEQNIDLEIYSTSKWMSDFSKKKKL